MDGDTNPKKRLGRPYIEGEKLAIRLLLRITPRLKEQIQASKLPHETTGAAIRRLVRAGIENQPASRN